MSRKKMANEIIHDLQVLTEQNNQLLQAKNDTIEERDKVIVKNKKNFFKKNV
jgi:hypothetical protein